MTQLLITNFLRSKGLMIGLLLLFITGLVSLHIGKIFLEQQANIAAKTAHYQAENHRQHFCRWWRKRRRNPAGHPRSGTQSPAHRHSQRAL